MKRLAITSILLAALIPAITAFAGGPGLAGVWKTAKGAEVTCDADSCTMTGQSDDPTANKPLGTVVLKGFSVDGEGVGTARHIHPIRDDAYLDIATKLDGDTLTLTFRIQSLESSTTWTRVGDAPTE